MRVLNEPTWRNKAFRYVSKRCQNWHKSFGKFSECWADLTCPILVALAEMGFHHLRTSIRSRKGGKGHGCGSSAAIFQAASLQARALQRLWPGCVCAPAWLQVSRVSPPGTVRPPAVCVAGCAFSMFTPQGWRLKGMPCVPSGRLADRLAAPAAEVQPFARFAATI